MVVLILPSWQLLCDRRDLARGGNCQMTKLQRKWGKIVDVVKIKHSTESFLRNRTFLTKVLSQLCKKSASDTVGADILWKRIDMKHLIPFKMHNLKFKGNYYKTVSSCTTHSF